MSASSKPPRHTHNAKPPTTERVARALLDAQVFGDKAAARKHGVHANTIKNWRIEWGPSERVTAEMDRLRALVRAEWIDEARDARRAIVNRMVTLAARSKNLTAVTNAGRRLNEMVMAHELTNDALGNKPDQQRDPEAPAGEGEGGGGGS